MNQHVCVLYRVLYSKHAMPLCSCIITNYSIVEVSLNHGQVLINVKSHLE